MKRYWELSAKEASSNIAEGSFRAEEYVSSTLQRVSELNPKLNIYITTVGERALEKARALDKKIQRGERVGRLAGVVLSVKDNICTQGIKTTCGSKMLENYVPPYDATVVKRLETEGAIIVGKTNMDEFAMGSTTELTAFSPTRNPWNPSYVPGGSSGGSGAALAAGMTPLALGSDTGGSVRCPASFCSVIGLKPTYGLVSRFGLVSYSNSLEQIGPMARTAYDCALLLSCMAGWDENDSTTTREPSTGFLEGIEGGVRGLKVGVVDELLGVGTQKSVERTVWRTLDYLTGEGAVCKKTSLPALLFSLPAYYVIAMAEASSNLARYDGLKFGFTAKGHAGAWSSYIAKSRSLGFGEEVKRRIILGSYVLSAGYYEQYYLKALRVRSLIIQSFREAFKKLDVLAGPSMPILPPRLGEKVLDPLEMYATDLDTVPANLAGLPAISVPAGFSHGLPIGVQFIAPPLREDLLLRVAQSLEPLGVSKLAQ